MTKEEELMHKQVLTFTQALSQTIMKETPNCIKTDGVVVTQAISIALAKTLGASIAVVTRGLSEKDVNEMTELILDFAR